MLCNMFLYVVQHIFRISAICIKCKYSGMILHLLQICRPTFALFAGSCRRMHKKHHYEIDNAPSPVRRKGGPAPLSCLRGNGAHGAPHPWSVFSTRADLLRSSASRKRRMPEALSRPGHPTTILSMKILAFAYTIAASNSIWAFAVAV